MIKTIKNLPILRNYQRLLYYYYHRHHHNNHHHQQHIIININIININFINIMNINNVRMNNQILAFYKYSNTIPTVICAADNLIIGL